MEKYITRESRTSSLESLSNKRPRDEDGTWHKPKRPAYQRRANHGAENLRTDNRFAGLNTDEEGESSINIPIKKPTRVPPIVVEVKKDWTHQMVVDMVSKFTKNFHLYYKGSGKIAINCYSGESHQLLKDGLRKDEVPFHTFTRKDEKMTKIVIRGLPACVTESAKEELESLGFLGVKIIKLQKTSGTESEFPPLLIQLPVGADIAKFKKIKYLCNCVIQVQKFHSNNANGIQCFRCQRFGHSSRNCNHSPRCVKCMENHETKSCPIKERTETVQCCNCQEKHPANYRACKERVKYLEQQKSVNNRTKIKEPSAKNYQPRTNGRSYTDVVQNKCLEKSEINPAVPPLKTNDSKFTNDEVTSEMLDILSVISNIKNKFVSCSSPLEKVILVLKHLGHYV